MGNRRSGMAAGFWGAKQVVTSKPDVPTLERGDFLLRDEFLRRWEAMPEVERAELIGGVVYIPPPPGRDHAEMEKKVAMWLGCYRVFTPGSAAANNATWLMLADAPQPDSSLNVLPQYGGQSRMSGPFFEGMPELAAEICRSSVSYDLHQKLSLYQEAGVREYVAVLMHERQVLWHRLVDGRFEVVAAAEDGLHRSEAFPGLWLDPTALLEGNMKRILAVLNEGLRSPEHAAWVAELARRYQTP